MPTEYQLGKEFAKQGFIAKKKADSFHDQTIYSINKLNRQLNLNTRRLYNSFFDRIDISREIIFTSSINNIFF